MSEIIPTILTSDLVEFSQKINLAKQIVEQVQIDIVDGKFAPKKTVTLESIKVVADTSGLGLDLHLMVDKPEEWVNRSLELLPDRIIGQVERMTDPKDFLNRVIEAGVEGGIALDLETPVSKIEPEVYHLADLILILSVKAGLGGQVFEAKALEKIKEVKAIVGDLVTIGVDGGLDEKNILLCKNAGAKVFYIGSNFWSENDLKVKYNDLIKLVREGE